MGKLSDILHGNGCDFNDRWNSTEAAGDFGPMPRGVYVCHATMGELESRRSNATPGYKIEFTIFDGDFKGRKLWHDCWPTPAGLPQAKRDLLKLAITSPAQMELPLRDHKSMDALDGLPDRQKENATMPTDPAILAQLQTLWGEPVTEATNEVDAASRFVASEFLPRPTSRERLADSPATWAAEAAELVAWFQNSGGSLPVNPFDLCSGCRVVEPARFYASLRAEIATGSTGVRAGLGTLQADLQRLRDVSRLTNSQNTVICVT